MTSQANFLAFSSHANAIHYNSYDSAVASYFSEETDAPKLISRHYEQVKALKYGVNPHQAPAAMSVIAGACGGLKPVYIYSLSIHREAHMHTETCIREMEIET